MLETYTLTYDLNGGNEAAPAKVSGIAKNAEITLTAEKNFTRNLNEIFVGWSVTKLDAALTAETKQEDLEKFLITGATYRIGTADVTLYAVWAIDSNGDGTPDYQTTYTVTYDLDGGIAVDGETYDEENVKPGETITIKAAPIRNDYAFTGWYDGTKTYKPGDNVTILDADLKLTAQWKKDLNPTNPTNPTDPTNPTNPTDPTKPTEPTDPTNPTNPTDPTKPTEPTDPTKPTEPTDPTRPTEPTDPTRPTDPTTSSKPDKSNDNTPQTGDETNLALWLVLLGISGMGAMITLLSSKRKYRGKYSKKK